MKIVFKPQYFHWLLIVLGTLLGIKTVWFIVQVIWLPAAGVNQPEKVKSDPLYYRVKLTPNKAPAPAVKKPKPVVSTKIKDIQLIGVYHTEAVTVVTILHKNQSQVLRRGEKVKEFTLTGGGHNYAIFTKGGKEYKVELDEKKAIGAITSGSRGKSATVPVSKEKKGAIVDGDGYKLIDRSLVNHYSKNLQEMGKNIGAVPVKKGNSIDGFRITYIRKKSDFAKLGLKRGDIIKAANGQELKSLDEAMAIYKQVDVMENLSLTIQRGNEEMELEYEVN